MSACNQKLIACPLKTGCLNPPLLISFNGCTWNFTEMPLKRCSASGVGSRLHDDA
jgi:hypothetical protein